MAEKIDKSLDEIIKQTRPSRGGRGAVGSAGGFRGRGGFGFQRGGGGFRRGGAGGFAGAGFPMRRFDAPGFIQKRRSAGDQLSPRRANAASINGQWSHDLYQNEAHFRRQTTSLANGMQVGGGPVKLVISNLDYGVNDSDIQGLFQEFGKIRKAAVHYDHTGRSLETADVIFERKSDAIRALTHYNGVCLDGRPMNIQLINSVSAFSNNNNNNNNNSNGVGQQRQPMRGGFSAAAAAAPGGNFGPPRRGNGGFGLGGRGGRQNNQQPAKSAADLDADLDAHNAKMHCD